MEDKELVEAIFEKAFGEMNDWPLPLEPPIWTHLHIGDGQYVECVNDELDCKVYLH